jgi:hypothetical protein
LTNYNDLLKFKKTFADKYSLVKQKLDNIYLPAANKIDNAISRINLFLSNKISESDLRIDELANNATSFINTYREYDISNKMPLASAVCSFKTLKHIVNNSSDYHKIEKREVWEDYLSQVMNLGIRGDTGK